REAIAADERTECVAMKTTTTAARNGKQRACIDDPRATAPGGAAVGCRAALADEQVERVVRCDRERTRRERALATEDVHTARLAGALATLGTADVELHPRDVHRNREVLQRTRVREHLGLRDLQRLVVAERMRCAGRGKRDGDAVHRLERGGRCE